MKTYQHARRLVLLALLATVALVGAQAARADVNMYFRAGTPVETRIVTDFSTYGADMVLVPGTRVYYVSTDEYDMYRYGRYYYVYDNGYWYRSSSPRRPFVFVQRAAVPRAVVYVPQGYRKHWTVVQRSERWTPAGHRHAKKHGYK